VGTVDDVPSVALGECATRTKIVRSIFERITRRDSIDSGSTLPAAALLRFSGRAGANGGMRRGRSA